MGGQATRAYSGPIQSMRYRVKIIFLAIPTIALITFYVLFLMHPEWFPS